jgi:hypothetical protein
VFGEAADFLVEGLDITLNFHGDTPVVGEIPAQVVLRVVEAAPTMKGETAAPSYKRATCEGSIEVRDDAPLLLQNTIRLWLPCASACETVCPCTLATLPCRSRCRPLCRRVIPSLSTQHQEHLCDVATNKAILPENLQRTWVGRQHLSSTAHRLQPEHTIMMPAWMPA